MAIRADDGSRTRDLWLGKPTLYQLSYVRISAMVEPKTRFGALTTTSDLVILANRLEAAQLLVPPYLGVRIAVLVTKHRHQRLHILRR